MNNAVTCHSLESFKTHGISQINQFTSFWPSESKLLVLVDDIEFPEKYYKEYNWDKERIILNRFSNKELERFKRKYTKKKYNGHKFFNSIRTLNPIKFLYRLRFFSYSFLFDVCKFSHKVFAMYEGAQFFKKGLLYWLDGDLITHTRVDDRANHGLAAVTIIGIAHATIPTVCVRGRGLPLPEEFTSLGLTPGGVVAAQVWLVCRLCLARGLALSSGDARAFESEVCLSMDRARGAHLPGDKAPAVKVRGGEQW